MRVSVILSCSRFLQITMTNTFFRVMIKKPQKFNSICNMIFVFPESMLVLVAATLSLYCYSGYGFTERASVIHIGIENASKFTYTNNKFVSVLKTSA